MSIVVEERFESREVAAGESPSADLQYWISGTNDDEAALGAMLAAAPLIYGPLVYKSATCKPLGYELWEGSVRYGPYKKEDTPETGDSSYQFDTGGGTTKITQSLATSQSKAPAGKTAPNFNGAIGVTHDGVDGVDITIPVYNFSETHILADESVDGAYKAAIFALTGTTNDATFRGFAVGEVLFLGASGSKRGEDDWEITFKFAASPNVAGLVVGTITGINKGGWEYLWIRYADEEDAAAKVLVKKPIAAYVEKVYNAGDFSNLGLG